MAGGGDLMLQSSGEKEEPKLGRDVRAISTPQEGQALLLSFLLGEGMQESLGSGAWPYCVTLKLAASWASMVLAVYRTLRSPRRR